MIRRYSFLVLTSLAFCVVIASAETPSGNLPTASSLAVPLAPRSLRPLGDSKSLIEKTSMEWRGGRREIVMHLGDIPPGTHRVIDFVIDPASLTYTASLSLRERTHASIGADAIVGEAKGVRSFLFRSYSRNDAG